MFSTKTRNTTIALMTSFGVAGLAVVPTVAQALPREIETPGQKCTRLYMRYLQDKLTYENALETHNYELIAQAKTVVKNDIAAGKQGGCSWAGGGIYGPSPVTEAPTTATTSTQGSSPESAPPPPTQLASAPLYAAIP